MQPRASAQSHKALTLNTIAFTVCFAAWMMNGVLVTFLATNEVFDWGPVETRLAHGYPGPDGIYFPAAGRHAD